MEEEGRKNKKEVGRWLGEGHTQRSSEKGKRENLNVWTKQKQKEGRRERTKEEEGK